MSQTMQQRQDRRWGITIESLLPTRPPLGRPAALARLAAATSPIAPTAPGPATRRPMLGRLPG